MGKIADLYADAFRIKKVGLIAISSQGPTGQPPLWLSRVMRLEKTRASMPYVYLA
jgi:hypothetical protein